IFSWTFLRLFIVSMALHAAWDMPIFVHENFYLQYIILIFIGWIFIFVLISAGLRQIDRLNAKLSPDDEETSRSMDYRSEERRVGKGGRCRGGRCRYKVMGW